MNNLLLIAIRLSSKRIQPAVDRQRKKRPIQEIFLQYFRILSPLGEIPINVNESFQFFLNGSIVANTKTGDVFTELVEAGHSLELIWHNDLHSRTRFIHFFRICYRLIWFFGLLYNQRKAFRTWDIVSLQILVGYEGYKSFFKRHNHLIPIIISDVSPTLHMQWSGALAVGNRVMWWQDDYHHYNGFSNENYLPYRCTYAAVLNQKGLETILSKNSLAKIYIRNQIEVKFVKSISQNPKVGIATNAFFEARADQIELLEKIKKNLGVEFLKLRLHPNSRVKAGSFPEGVEIAAINESISDFVKSVDLAVVGNSAVQLKLLCEGIPVVHIAGLDNYGFDLYKYCRNGFCFGTNDIDGLDLTLIKRFYSEPLILEKLKRYVNVKSIERCQPLSLLSQIHKN
ncbi:hypothetical protein [Lunatibacter salilacus]|uniref:hypothetical protein n=1 Tax=Lunatibacter salilacus TaxID=2483804 RepID=UPI00131E0176|nr:hypothetical protein [Lunatibacter salilacus]